MGLDDLPWILVSIGIIGVLALVALIGIWYQLTSRR